MNNNYQFKIRGFVGCQIYLSNYDNGNILADVRDQRGCLVTVLTEQVNHVLPEGIMVLKETEYNRGFLFHLLNGNYINFYKPYMLGGKKVIVCGITGRVTAEKGQVQEKVAATA